MLKLYQTQSHSGGSHEFWEANWVESNFEQSVRFCAIDPLRPFFEEYLRPHPLTLEGGCGPGNFVAYYSGRGVEVVGLDFEGLKPTGIGIEKSTIIYKRGNCVNI